MRYKLVPDTKNEEGCGTCVFFSMKDIVCNALVEVLSLPNATKCFERPGYHYIRDGIVLNENIKVM